MHQLRFFQLFLLLCTAVASEKIVKEEIEFLQDFLETVNDSYQVVAYLCWSKGEIQYLSRKFSDSLIAHIILNNKINNKDNKSTRKIFIVDITCKDAYKIIFQGSKENLFRKPLIWIILGTLSQIKSYNFYFPINSVVYVAQKYKSGFIVNTIYKCNESMSEYIENDIADWKTGKGFLYFYRISTEKNRTNLMGTPIRASYILEDQDTVNHMFDYRNTHIDQLTKINYILISHLADLFNASKVDIWTNTWGYKNQTTNTYDGMFGDLLYGRADISGTTALVQVERMKYFTFFAPTTKDKLRFVFRAPPMSYTANVFVLPFDAIVWSSFFLTIMVSAVLIYIIVIYEWKYDIKIDNQRRNRLPPRLFEVVMLQISAVTQRGGFFEPKTFSGRIVSFGTFVLCMFMYTAFSGYIVVVLQSTSNSIKDLDSLYSSKIGIGSEDTVYNKHYFTVPSKDTNETYRKLIFENRMSPKGKDPNFFSAREGMEKVRKEFFAFSIQLSTAYKLVKETFKEEEKCKIKYIDTIFKIGDQYLSVPRNSVYLDHFLVGFRRFFETGLHQREYVHYFPSKPECNGRLGSYVSVGLIDCYFPFLIFGTGILISGTILLIEKFVEAFTKSKLSVTPQYLN